MDPRVADVEHFVEKIEDLKEGGPSFHCDLYDTEVVHKIAQAFIPGLATACVDNTTGDIFRSPGSVAADIRKEMVDYLTHRSESFVAEHIVLEGGSEVEASNDPFNIISDFIDDFATSKRNLFSRVSGWLLSERREDNIDDFAQEMEINGFWLMDHREAIAQTLLKNVDFKNSSHCKMNFKTEEELAEHVENCGYRSMHCENEGCTAIFCANQMENHDSACPFKIIPCEQNCSESIMRRAMDRHCITACPMKLVNCPFYAVGCVSGVPQCELQQHRVDHLSSHLMYVLRGIYKEASPDDLKPRVEQIQQLSTQLAEARDTRSLTYLVKDFDAKLGPLEIKPKDEVYKAEKDITDSTVNVAEETAKKVMELEVEIAGKVEDEKLERKDSTAAPPDKTGRKALEDDENESENGVADGVMEEAARKALEDDDNESENGVADGVMEEATRKVSEGEMRNNVKEDRELIAEEARETDGVNKEGEERNKLEAHLLKGTVTNAPEVVVMAEDREDASKTKDSGTYELDAAETKDSEDKVTENIDEEGTETKNSTNCVSGESKTETPTTLVMDEKDEEATQTMKSTETKELEDKVTENIDEEGTETKNSTNCVSEESKTETPTTIVMDTKDEEATQTMKSTETKDSEDKVTENIDEEGTETKNSTNRVSEESKTETPTTIVMDKKDEEATQTTKSTTHVAEES